MKEYKIIEGTPADCQKRLNQWRHEFEIEILSQSIYRTDRGESHDDYRETYLVITLTREKKNG